MYQLSSKQIQRQALIYLEQANVAIFSHQIVHYISPKNKTISSLNTNFSIPDTQPTDQIICFGKQDVAFRIDEKEKKIQIIKIKKEKIELEFKVIKTQTLLMIQDVLRRKLCEIGFEEKYKIIKQLGKGATAKVYLVERKSDSKLFAAKIISIKESEGKSYDTFINETKLLRHVKNKHIVSIQSLYIEKKELISVLQYLEGGTLLEELKEDRVKTDRQKLKVVKDIAEGIQHLRQKRIVHRDLKLQNIMVRKNADKTKDYVITDFGLACWIGQKELIYEKCGTPGYIAPEILRASRNKIIVSHVSDIFSFGVICHFVFLLKAVFAFSGSAKQLLQANKKASFSLSSKIHMNLLASEHDILRKTLELDPAKRVSSQQLLDVWIKNFQKDVNFFEKRTNRFMGDGKKQEQSETMRIKLKGKSIEMIEKRAPSIQKIYLSTRMKTQHVSSKKDKKENSVSKFLNKVWNSISTSRSQVIKPKEGSQLRKKEMQSFIN